MVSWCIYVDLLLGADISGEGQVEVTEGGSNLEIPRAALATCQFALAIGTFQWSAESPPVQM